MEADRGLHLLAAYRSRSPQLAAYRAGYVGCLGCRKGLRANRGRVNSSPETPKNHDHHSRIDGRRAGRGKPCLVVRRGDDGLDHGGRERAGQRGFCAIQGWFGGLARFRGVAAGGQSDRADPGMGSHLPGSDRTHRSVRPRDASDSCLLDPDAVRGQGGLPRQSMELRNGRDVGIAGDAIPEGPGMAPSGIGAQGGHEPGGHFTDRTGKTHSPFPNAGTDCFGHGTDAIRDGDLPLETPQDPGPGGGSRLY